MQKQRRDGQHQRVRQPGADQHADFLTGDNGPPELAPEKIAQPVEILHVHRLIEPPLAAQFLDPVRGYAVGVGNEPDRVTRHQLHHREQHDRDHEHGEYAQAESPDHIVEHCQITSIA